MRAAEFLRDLVRKGAVRPMYIAGVLMLADLLTKTVSRPVFIELMRLFATFARDGVTPTASPQSSASLSPPPSPPPSPPGSEAGDSCDDSFASESESEFDGVEDAPEDVAPYVAPFPQALPVRRILLRRLAAPPTSGRTRSARGFALVLCRLSPCLHTYLHVTCMSACPTYLSGIIMPRGAHARPILGARPPHTCHIMFHVCGACVCLRL